MEIEDRAGFPYGAQQHMNGIFLNTKTNTTVYELETHRGI